MKMPIQADKNERRHDPGPHGIYIILRKIVIIKRL